MYTKVNALILVEADGSNMVRTFVLKKTPAISLIITSKGTQMLKVGEDYNEFSNLQTFYSTYIACTFFSLGASVPFCEFVISRWSRVF